MEVIQADELIRVLIETRHHGNDAVVAALAALRAATPGTNVPAAPTATDELLRTYRRRARHLPSGVLGLQWTIERLEGLPDKEIVLAVQTTGHNVATVVLTATGELVGCVFGPDRREVGVV